MHTLTTFFAKNPNKFKKEYQRRHYCFLYKQFLKANESNKLVAKVSGKRKREVGLVVPAKFKALTKEYRLAKILDEELHTHKEKYTLRSETWKNHLKNFHLCIKEY